MALASPELAGHVVMRFLDPDEANLRLLSRGNPFGAWSRASRGVGTEAADAVRDDDAPGGDALGRVAEDREEEEDFNSLTESLGGFG